MIHYTFTAKSDGARILKIGQHLPKLWAIKYRVLFLRNKVYSNYGSISCRFWDIQCWKCRDLEMGVKDHSRSL